MNDEIRKAEADGWERSIELRFVERDKVLSDPHDKIRVLQQRWVRTVHGYGHDELEDRWIDVPLYRGDNRGSE